MLEFIVGVATITIVILIAFLCLYIVERYNIDISVIIMIATILLMSYPIGKCVLNFF